jgi:hypothetical protein
LINQDNYIKEITQLYAGFSFYYSDFLSLNEIIYNNNNGLQENHLSRIRVIEKNTLGEYIAHRPIKNIKESLNTALLNSKVASILSGKKKIVYYPYIHTHKKKFTTDIYSDIDKVNRKISNYERKYKPQHFDFTMKNINKLIISNIGTIIEQNFTTVKLNINKEDRTIFEHYKINNLKDVNFPIIDTNKIEKIYERYNLILSPRVVGKLALHLFDNKIDVEALKLEISTYLYKGVQSGLYDDEGTTRINSKYNGLNGGNIFQNNNSCGYFYDFSKNDFVVRQPDLQLNPGNTLFKDITQDYYFLANDFDKIVISDQKIVINCDLSLFSKEKDLGYMIKKVVIPIGELKNIKNFTKNSEVIGLINSSIKAPYIYIGKNYE